MRMTRCAFLLLATLAVTACAESAVVISASVVRSDSAGLSIVTLEDRLSSYAEIAATDTVVLKGAPEDLFANNPQMMIPLRDGRTLVSDGNLVASFDSAGAFVSVAMPQGRGPGEVASVDALWQSPDDSLWVADVSAGRLSRLAPDLRFARSTPYPRFTDQTGLSVWTGLSGDTLAVAEFGVDENTRAPGLFPINYRLGTLIIGSETPSLGEPRQFGVSERLPDGVLPRGYSIGQPFAPNAQWRAYGRCMVYGYPERWELRIEAPDSSGAFTTVAYVRAPRDSGVAVAAQRKEQYIVETMARMPQNSEFPRAQFERALREHVSFPARLPNFGRVLTSADGAIWVQRFRESAQREPDQWTIVDVHGTRAWRLRLPIGSRLLAVRPQGALVTTRDADDIETQAWWVLPQLDGLRPIPKCRSER